MSIMPMIYLVGLLLLSVAVNPFHKQARTEDLEQTSLDMMQREAPQKLGTIMLAVGLVVILTALVTVLVYVPFE